MEGLEGTRPAFEPRSVGAGVGEGVQAANEKIAGDAPVGSGVSLWLVSDLLAVACLTAEELGIGRLQVCEIGQVLRAGERAVGSNDGEDRHEGVEGDEEPVRREEIWRQEPGGRVARQGV